MSNPVAVKIKSKIGGVQSDRGVNISPQTDSYYSSLSLLRSSIRLWVPFSFDKGSLSRCLSFRSQQRRIWFGSLHPKNIISLFKSRRVFAKMRSGRVAGGFLGFVCYVGTYTQTQAAATFSVCLYNRNPLMWYWCGYGNRKRRYQGSNGT